MSDDKIEDLRVALVKEVQRICSLYDALARNDAIEFARKPNDGERKMRASNSVAIADALERASVEITEAVNVTWGTMRHVIK